MWGCPEQFHHFQDKYWRLVRAFMQFTWQLKDTLSSFNTFMISSKLFPTFFEEMVFLFSGTRLNFINALKPKEPAGLTSKELNECRNALKIIYLQGNQWWKKDSEWNSNHKWKLNKLRLSITQNNQWGFYPVLSWPYLGERKKQRTFIIS